MIYFELPKVPEIASANGELMYWLSLFKAKTEEELTKIEKEGGAIMAQAIAAYRHISASEKFKELERIRVRRLQDEASALGNAERKGENRKAIAIAKMMKSENFDVNMITKMTGLTVDDILQL
jgi:predicted transposase/invertase (TIGR01784 family)